VVEQRSAPARPSSGQRSRRKISWDVVRGGCVALVLIYHSTFLSVVVHPELAPRPVYFPFQVGASSLLVISAYFVCATIGRDSPLRYWFGRIARLVPPFVGACVTIWVLLQFAPPDYWLKPTVGDLVSNVLMLWHWKPSEYGFLDGSHWTVPLQLLGFTAAALLYRSRFRHRPRILVIMWAALILPIAQWQIRLAGPPEAYRTIVDGIGAHRWHLFVAGVAIWMWSTNRLGTPHFAALLGTSMFAHGLHNFMRDTNGVLISDWGSTAGVCVVMVLLALTAAYPDWGEWIPQGAHRPIQWFAGVSYGVFLMHQTVGYIVCLRLQQVGAGPVVQVVGMIAAGVLLGWALTRIVEQPSHRFLTAKYDRWAGLRQWGRQGGTTPPLRS
jgi:peptidoglycan/LPS O-acetylase OafA/YrhL